jgi:hypothetical protein
MFPPGRYSDGISILGFQVADRGPWAFHFGTEATIRLSLAALRLFTIAHFGGRSVRNPNLAATISDAAPSLTSLLKDSFGHPNFGLRRQQRQRHNRSANRKQRATDKSGGAVGQPSCQSSLLSDPNAEFSAEMWRQPTKNKKNKQAATSALISTFS